MRSRWAVGLLALAAGAAIAAEPSTSTTSAPSPDKVKLSHVALGSGVPVYTRGLMGGDMMVIGRNSLSLSPNKRIGDITIDETTVSVAWGGPPRMEFGVKVGTKVTPLAYRERYLDSATFELAKDRKYTLAFPLVMGGEKDVLVSYRSGGVQKGVVSGQGIAFFDTNTDGKYTLGQDAVRFGNAASALAFFGPTAKYLSSGATIIEVQDLSADGKELTATKYTGATGKLTVTSNLGLDVQAAVVAADGELSLVAAPAPSTEFSVIPGDYKLLYGTVYATGLRKVAGTFVAGTRAAVTVKEGEKTKLEIGGPLTLAFDPNAAGRKVSISSGSFSVKGKNGEIYSGFSHASEPEVAWVVDGRTIPAGKMEFG